MPLNDYQQRYLLSSFRHMETLLSNIEALLSSGEKASPFSSCLWDLISVQKEVTTEFIARLREQMAEALTGLGITWPKPEVSSRWAIRSILMNVLTLLVELEPRYIRGYGALEENAEKALTGFVATLQKTVQGLLDFLSKAPGQGDLTAQFEEDKERCRMPSSPIDLELPDLPAKRFTDLVLDFTGTLSQDGRLLPGVAERLAEIANHLRIFVLTADTFGRARAELAGLPVEVHLVGKGRDKADFVGKLGAEQVIAIGNGRNDVPLLKLAGLGIAVIGPEGIAGELLRAADIVVRDIREALDLIANPLRMKATLRD